MKRIQWDGNSNANGCHWWDFLFIRYLISITSLSPPKYSIWGFVLLHSTILPRGRLRHLMIIWLVPDCRTEPVIKPMSLPWYMNKIMIIMCLIKWLENTQGHYNDGFTITLTANWSFFFVLLVKFSVKNTSNESADHEKNPQWKKYAAQFPGGTWLQTVPDFFSWLKYNYLPPEKHQECEYFGRMVLNCAPWCSRLAPWLIWRCQVGCGVEDPAGGRNTGKQGPHPEETTHSSQLLIFVTGPGN